MSCDQPKARKESHKVRQACECCRSRKIRCGGHNPCQNCERIKLPCVYQVPKKKGPKTAREKLTDGYHGFQIQHNIHNIHSIHDMHDIHEIRDHQTPAGFISRFQASPLLSLEIMQSCLDTFFTYKYPIMPILDRDKICTSIQHLNESPTQYSLITALCAVITLQTEISSTSAKEGDLNHTRQLDSMLEVEFFIREACRARGFCSHIDDPSLASVQSSFFLFACFFGLGKDNAAWFYLREAITILQLLRLHEETTYSSMTDPQYATYCRRTFWLLFVTERAYALQRQRPLTLRRSIDLPAIEDGPEAIILAGFLDLVALFQNFGDSFMALWNSSEDASVSSRPLIKLQDFLKCAISNVSERTEIQQADLLVSRQWLKTIVWQLCLSKGMLSSNSIIDSMSFHYPVDIARDVILASRLLPLRAFQAHGVGISEKIFDIGCSLTDVLLVHPTILHISTLQIGPKDYLMELVRILGTDIEGSSKYLRLLARRADECLGVRLQKSLSPSDRSPGICEIDWDEGANDSDVAYGSPLSIASR